MKRVELEVEHFPASSNVHYLLYFQLKRIGKERFQDSEPPDEYGVTAPEIVIVLEQLRRASLIPKTELFDDKDRIVEAASDELIASLFLGEGNPGVFGGLEVGVIGGHEAEMFASLGARAIGIDPVLENFPKSKVPNLTEIPERLGRGLAATMREKFDLTFSTWLFDRGSGLDLSFRFLGSPVTEGEAALYVSYLKVIMDMTKVGGISVHNGNMMPYALGGLDENTYRVQSTIARFPEYKWGSHSVYVALQRMG